MASPRPRPAASPRGARFGPFFNTLIVAGGYLLSRVLGLGRDVIISAQFGTLPEYGAYRATFSILDLIYIVIAGGALGSAFIPVFAGFLSEQREDDAWRLASGLLNLAFVALVLACLLIGLLADPLVALTIGRGFTPDQRALTALLLRLMLVQPVLLGVGGLAKATLESFDRFALPAIGANLYNMGIIGGALLASWLGIAGLVWGVVAGAALFLLVQLPGLRGVGWHYIPTLRFDAPGVRQVGRLLGPRLIGQSAWQIGLVAIASFASQLGEGAVTANAAAIQLMMLPHGLIALSLGTVIFPQLARHYAAGDMVSLRAAMLLALLSTPVVRALYQRGRFGAISTALTAEALTFYALGLAAFAAAEIIVRTFYAMHDPRTPVYVGVGAVLMNIVLGWTFLRLGLGLGGLALAFSTANIAETITLLVLLSGQLGALGSAFWYAIGRMALAALAFGAALLGALRLSEAALPFLRSGDTYHWPADFPALVAWLAVVCSAGTAIYLGGAAALGVEEVQTLVGKIAALGRRFKHP